MSDVKKYKTIFCDIDGTVFRYRKFRTYTDVPAVPVPSMVNQLRKLKAAGHMIIMTSARPEHLYDFTVAELEKNNVPYDKIVLGCARGTRYLVNDKQFTDIDRAYAINVERDEGLTEEDISLFEKP